MLLFRSLAAAIQVLGFRVKVSGTLDYNLPNVCVCVYTYIYIYRERERERVLTFEAVQK